MTNKLKVQTSTYIARKREETIVKILKVSEIGLTPKLIAFESNRTDYPIKHNTVKSILKRLELSKRVIKESRGYYKLVDDSTHEDDIFSYNLHNIVLTYSFDALTIDSKISETINAYLGKITFGIGAKSKKATMCISTDYPFSFASIGLLAIYFEQKIIEHCGIKISANKILIKSIEFNKDYKGLKLEGINSLTLTNCVANFKIYQKENRVRKEYRINEPISMNLLLGILGSNLNNFNYIPEMVDVKEKVESFDKKLTYMFKFLKNKNIKTDTSESKNNVKESYGWTASSESIKEKKQLDSDLETTDVSMLYYEEYSLL